MNVEFEELVKQDLINFVSSSTYLEKRGVLVFPPVNSYYRFIIHRLVTEQPWHLQSFSIGIDKGRRTVVCHPNLLLNELVNEEVTLNTEERSPVPRSCKKLKITHQDMERVTHTGKSENSSLTSQPRPGLSKTEVMKGPGQRTPILGRGRGRQRPSAEIYVPGALGRARQLNSPSQKRRVEPKEQVSDRQTVDTGTPDERVALNIDKQETMDNNCSPVVTDQEALSVTVGPEASRDNEGIDHINQNELLLINESQTEKSYSEKSQTEQLQPKKPQAEQSKTDEIHPAEAHTEKSQTEDLQPQGFQTEEVRPERSQVEKSQTKYLQPVGSETEKSKTEQLQKEEPHAIKSQMEETQTSESKESQTDDTHDIPESGQTKKSKNQLKKEQKKSTKHKDQSKHKKKVADKTNTKSETKDVPATECGTKTVKQVEKLDDSNEEDESWDAMFDEEGECLDESLMKELEKKVGKVQIKKPVIDYLNFSPKDPELDVGEYGNLIEIYDFPSTLKTADLMNIFKPTIAKDFNIVWVDDTHAIGVFSSELAAQDALMYQHPIVKVRSIQNATRDTKLKAKSCLETLLPSKARPATSAMAARRLVSASLGLVSNISKEQKLKERQLLKEAKEKKRSDIRNKESVWEGTVASDEKPDNMNNDSNSPQRERNEGRKFGRCAMDEV